MPFMYYPVIVKLKRKCGVILISDRYYQYYIFYYKNKYRYTHLRNYIMRYKKVYAFLYIFLFNVFFFYIFFLGKLRIILYFHIHDNLWMSVLCNFVFNLKMILQINLRVNDNIRSVKEPFMLCYMLDIHIPASALLWSNYNKRLS